MWIGGGKQPVNQTRPRRVSPERCPPAWPSGASHVLSTPEATARRTKRSLVDIDAEFPSVPRREKKEDRNMWENQAAIYMESLPPWGSYERLCSDIMAISGLCSK